FPLLLVTDKQFMKRVHRSNVILYAQLLSAFALCFLNQTAQPAVWVTNSSLNTARQHHTATLLPNGKVLVIGGDNGVSPLSSAELLGPGDGDRKDGQPKEPRAARQNRHFASQRPGAGHRRRVRYQRSIFQ